MLWGRVKSGGGIRVKQASLNKDVQLRHIMVSLEKSLGLLECGGVRLEREEGTGQERPCVPGSGAWALFTGQQSLRDKTCRQRREGQAFILGVTIPLSTLSEVDGACMESGLESWKPESPIRKIYSCLVTEAIRTTGGRGGQEWMLRFKF